MRRVILALAVIGLVIGSITAGARVVLSAGAAKPENSALSGGHGVAEGLRVHGDWRIDVRNPDGSIASTDEFRNAFKGTHALTNVLLGERSVGAWAIHLAEFSSSAPCDNVFGCVITEPNGSGDPESTFKTLTKESRDDGFRLRGTATAMRNGQIDSVSSALQFCGPTVAPSDCQPTSGSPFTGTSIEPVSVVTGQQILVTVDITFS